MEKINRILDAIRIESLNQRELYKQDSKTEFNTNSIVHYELSEALKRIVRTIEGIK